MLLYSAEMVCGGCRSVELAFLNMTWAYEMALNSS